MSTLVQIKRSYSNTAPQELYDGELAYSFLSNTLFIGNSSNSVVNIGGQYVFDAIDQASSTGAANTILKLNEFGSFNVNTIYLSTETPTSNNQVATKGYVDSILSIGGSITINAGDGLANGGSVALGSSIQLDVDNTVVRTNGDQTIDGNIVFSNTVTISGINVGSSLSLSYDKANSAYELANLSYTQANLAYDTANASFEQANLAYTQANTATVTANTSFGQANLAYDQANTATTTANLAYDQANTATVTANLAYDQANAAFDLANSTNGISSSAYAQANAAYEQGNNAYSTANAAYAQANLAYDEANTKLPLVGGTLTGDLIVSGNLSVLGNTTTFNVETVLVEDNELVLNSNAEGAPTVNAGILINRGDQANVFIRWNEGDDVWGWSDNGTDFYSFNQTRAQANLAYDQANTALEAANTRVLRSGDTMTGNLNVAATLFVQNIIPTAFQTYDLGSAEFPFRDLYLSGETLRLGNTSISVVGGGEVSILNLKSDAINTNTILVQGYNVYSGLLSAYEAANLKIETLNVSGALTLTTSNTDNVVVANIEVRDASTAQTGVVQLYDGVDSNSDTLAATANAVQFAYEEANNAFVQFSQLSVLYDSIAAITYNYVIPRLNIADNTVQVSANSGSTLSNVHLNFVNTSDILVSVVAGENDAAGNANISFSLANTINVSGGDVTIKVDDTEIGARRILDFVSANSSNLTIVGADDAGNNKIVITLDNPKLGGTGGTSSFYGNAELYISDNPPVSPNSNTSLWWRANTGKFYIYYGDGSSDQWVSLTPTAIVNISNDLTSTSNVIASSANVANALNSIKADRSGDTFTGNVNIYQNDVQLNLTSQLIESNNDLTINTSTINLSNTSLIANTVVIASNNATLVDSLSINEFRTVKYLYQVENANEFQVGEILLVHDDTLTYMTEYATLITESSLGTFSSNVQGQNVQLFFTPVFENNTINITRISMRI
jgi:hypothetical protein